MLRPVEFNTARDPGAEQSHERRLDDVLAIEKVVLVCLVESGVNAAADLGKNHELNEFVFEKNSLVGFVHSLQRNTIDKWIRINFSAATLINPLLKKHRVRVRILHWVGGDRDQLFPAADSVSSVGLVQLVRASGQFIAIANMCEQTQCAPAVWAALIFSRMRFSASAPQYLQSRRMKTEEYGIVMLLLSTST